jgi:hypothetical protein
LSSSASSIGALAAASISFSISLIWFGSIVNSWGASAGASTKERLGSLKINLILKK